MYVCVSECITDLFVDSAIPSLLHSTTTVEDGGGLTLHGSTTVWPTRASTVSGSLLSMVTPPRVRLRTEEVAQQGKEGRKGEKEKGRKERRKEEEDEKKEEEEEKKVGEKDKEGGR